MEREYKIPTRPEPIKFHRENGESNLLQLLKKTTKLPPLKLPRKIKQPTSQGVAQQFTPQQNSIVLPPIRQI